MSIKTPGWFGHHLKSPYQRLPKTKRITMTPEAQRIAIAEACGWERWRPLDDTKPITVWRNTKGTNIARFENLPDYLNDLNVMHEAEKVLTYEQLPFYVSTLKNPILMKEEGVSDFDCIHATAAQRAKAFLRTLGLWVD